MVKHPHPSGRPIRRERKGARSQFNYLPEPNIVYATARLRPRPALPVADAIGYRRTEEFDDSWQGIHWVGFIHFKD